MPNATFYTIQQIKNLEQLAIAGTQEVKPISEFELMQRAGEAVFALIKKNFPKTTQILTVCGAGNNAGDGYIVAGLAKKAGLSSECCFLKQPDILKPPARLAYNWSKTHKIVVKPFQVYKNFNHADIIIDALLGTGFSGQLHQNYLEAIKMINRSGKPVLAVDIPSGLNADTGEFQSVVNATITVTFIGKKQGFQLPSAMDVCGKIYLNKLGLPAIYFTKPQFGVFEFFN